MAYDSKNDKLITLNLLQRFWENIKSKLGSYLPLTGGTLTGNLSGQYITGTWLQATAANHTDSKQDKVAVFDKDGWLYNRTLDELKSDIGMPDLTGYAKTTDVSTAVSDHNNDANAHLYMLEPEYGVAFRSYTFKLTDDLGISEDDRDLFLYLLENYPEKIVLVYQHNREYMRLEFKGSIPVNSDDWIYAFSGTDRVNGNTIPDVPISLLLFSTEIGTAGDIYMHEQYYPLNAATIEIPASSWDATAKTATVNVTGVTANCAVTVSPPEDSYETYVAAGIRCSAQDNGKLTFKCMTVPTADVNVNVKVG